MINSNALEIWLILQVILEGFLVFLIILFLFRLKKMDTGQVDMPPDLETSLERFLTESQKFSESFEQTLEEKRQISIDLVSKLDHKILEMRELLEQTETTLSKARKSPPQLVDSRANPAAPESRTMVLRLANKGLSIEDIARQAHLNRGEVELILDLEKQAGQR